jgi:hypothetical protein
VSSGVVMLSCRRWLASLLELVCVQWFMSCLTWGVEAGDDHGQHNACQPPRKIDRFCLGEVSSLRTRLAAV